jgi:hypothetical protein
MLIIPATINGFRLKVDGSAGINIATNELTNEQLLTLKDLNTKFVYLGIKEESFTASEKQMLKELKSDFELKEKTPGQRLRNVLFVAFNQNAEGNEDFESYYKKKMAGFVEGIKERLL